MTTRLLPPEEWHRLTGTEAEVCQLSDPAHTQVLVVEDDGLIVGTWAMLKVLHAECLWIHEDYRQTAAVGRRLWLGLKQQAAAQGALSVWTGSLSDEVTTMIEKVGGVPVPGASYVLPMGESCPRLS